MSWQLVMPQLGLTMEEGEVGPWYVEVGAEVAQGDVVCEIFTDKIDHSVEAPAAGRLERIVAPTGAIVPVGSPLGEFSETP